MATIRALLKPKPKKCSISNFLFSLCMSQNSTDLRGQTHILTAKPWEKELVQSFSILAEYLLAYLKLKKKKIKKRKLGYDRSKSSVTV